MNTFRIGIRSLEDAYKEFESAFEDLQAGKPVEKRQGFYFTSLDAARKILTKERIGLLHAIRGQGPSSIYELAKAVNRDLKNVQNDLALLHKHGLVRYRVRKDNQRGAKVPEVPYRHIDLRIDL